MIPGAAMCNLSLASLMTCWDVSCLQALTRKMLQLLGVMCWLSEASCTGLAAPIAKKFFWVVLVYSWCMIWGTVKPGKPWRLSIPQHLARLWLMRIPSNISIVRTALALRLIILTHHQIAAVQPKVSSQGSCLTIQQHSP